MSRYLEILSNQTPFPFNIDDNRRVMYSVNFRMLVAAIVTAFEEEIAARIIAQTAATAIGTDIFIGPLAVIPTGDGPYTEIIDTGGESPEYIHNTDDASYERLSMQIVVRAKSYTVARTRAQAVWRALDGVRNTTLAA